MTNPKHITHDALLNAIHNDKTESNYKALAILLETVINDWPTINLKEPSDLLIELKEQIQKKLTFENVKNYLENLEVENEAWKMESLSSLLQMFDTERNGNFNKTISLDEIVYRISEYYHE